MFLLYLVIMLFLYAISRNIMSADLRMIWLLVTWSVMAVVYAIEAHKR